MSSREKRDTDIEDNPDADTMDADTMIIDVPYGAITKEKKDFVLKPEWKDLGISQNLMSDFYADFNALYKYPVKYKYISNIWKIMLIIIFILSFYVNYLPKLLVYISVALMFVTHLAERFLYRSISKKVSDLCDQYTKNRCNGMLQITFDLQSISISLTQAGKEKLKAGQQQMTYAPTQFESQQQTMYAPQNSYGMYAPTQQEGHYQTTYAPQSSYGMYAPTQQEGQHQTTYASQSSYGMFGTSQQDVQVYSEGKIV